MDAHFSSRLSQREELLREAAASAPSIGPFLGMGIDTASIVMSHEGDPEEFDRAFADAVRRRTARGYLVGAMQTAIAAITIHWGELTAGAFLDAYEQSPVPLYAAAGECIRMLLAPGVPAEGFSSLSASVGSDDQNLLVRILGAAARSAQRGGESERAERLLQIIVDTFDVVPPSETTPTVLNHRLSRRELEIGLLVGEMSNPAIAARLGLSRRTVENHVANAMRKTGTANRGELSTLLTQGI